MIGKNWQLVTNEPVEFEKQPVEVQDCRNITHLFRGFYRRIYPNLIKENRRMSTCNRLDLQTLGSQPIIMPKNLPDHWLSLIVNQSPAATWDWFFASLLHISACIKSHIAANRPPKIDCMIQCKSIVEVAYMPKGPHLSSTW